MSIPVKKGFYLFSLRQGTMLVGIVVLLLSGFCLFLLLLGSAHAHEMASMLENDMQESTEHEGPLIEDDMIESNNIILNKAHNLAILVIVWLYLGVALATVHLVLCVLLLYGAIMRVRQLLLPWICVALLGLALCCTAMVVTMYLVKGYGALVIFIASSLTIGLGFYMWLVVYSHYLELGGVKGCSFNAKTHHSIAERCHLMAHSSNV